MSKKTQKNDAKKQQQQNETDKCARNRIKWTKFF